MFDNQILIKALLITVFLVFAYVLVVPRRGARRLAVRRIVLLLVFAGGVVAVTFPELINSVANVLGVGRGTDLVLYALVVVFIGNSIASSAKNRQLEREITQLARAIALQEAPRVDGADGDAS